MDLTTTYMGLELKHPIVPSAAPVSESLEGIKKLADAGASAVVMFSLFEEQLMHDAAALEEYTSLGADSSAEFSSYFPEPAEYRVGPEKYLDLISQASQAVDIPIIGSLNGISNEGWVEYARQIQEAGAKALELNVFYIPTDMEKSGAAVEQQYLDVLKAVKGNVDIPVAIKLSPFFSSMAHMAKELDDAGADALVLFNRFYQPDIDLDQLSVLPNLNLSTPHEIRLPLLWLAVLYGKVKASLGATRGVHSAQEVIKYIMAGADVVFTTSSLLKYGIGHLTTLLSDLERWMEEHEYASIEQMRGSMSQQSVADPTTFERGNYIKILEKYKSEYTLA